MSTTPSPAPGHPDGQAPVSDRGIATVARLFCETWAELAVSLPDSYSCLLTCGEADALADLFRATGDDGTADAVISAHAEYDEPGESHYPSEPEAGS